MPVKDNTFNKYLNTYFIETGCYMGDGITQAIQSGFKFIKSIELSDKYFNMCVDKFRSFENVEIIKGDSAKVLSDVIENIDERITFWLDGHHSCGDTALGEYWSPLLVELAAIKKHKIKTHTILIDDMRCWKEKTVNHDWDTEDVMASLKEINSDYTFTFIDGLRHEKDILVAAI